MLLYRSVYMVLAVVIVDAVQFPSNSNSDVSSDTDNTYREQNKTIFEQSDQDVSRELEIEKSNEEIKDKKFLADAMETILDPNSVIIERVDTAENFTVRVENISKQNISFEIFMEEMDKLSLEVCKKSQEALWNYVTDINNPVKKNNMVKIASEEDEVKKQYWNIFKQKYQSEDLLADSKLKRKLRVIKERGINVQMPQSKQRDETDEMQAIWSGATVCAFKAKTCNEDTARTMIDIMNIFKTSNDTDELAYYWKGYRDVTGKKVRPIFKNYVTTMNAVAELEKFNDAGEMWRFMFEDDNFSDTVNRIWRELKPLYDVLHEYVRLKLKAYYKNNLSDQEQTIPAHLLGNLWAQDWQAIYSLVTPYPEHKRPKLFDSNQVSSIDLFDSVDQFYETIGFESSKESYSGIIDSFVTANCLPSSHDMCDGVHYKIKWCREKVTDISVGLSRAARLLGHIQYFKSYQAQPLLYRDGPTPAFHEALSDIIAIQVTSPEHLKILNLIDIETGHEATMNRLLSLALERLPLMAYSFILDRWRWDVLSNKTYDNWNGHWWDLRVNETGLTPPVPRNESDLDPASKYHVVSHAQYITYLISNVIEFQILIALCNATNHTGPLHECTIYGNKQAGNILRKGMSLGASEDWRTVMQAMTGETELSTKGILEYFAVLREFLEEHNKKFAKSVVGDMDASTPIIIGLIVILLTATIIIAYCMKKHNLYGKIFSTCGFGKNGSLDIVANEITSGKPSDIEGIVEDKV